MQVSNAVRDNIYDRGSVASNGAAANTSAHSRPELSIVDQSGKFLQPVSEPSLDRRRRAVPALLFLGAAAAGILFGNLLGWALVGGASKPVPKPAEPSPPAPSPGSGGENSENQLGDSADGEQDISSDQLDASRRKGEIVSVSSDSGIHARVMAALDKSIETTRAAIERVSRGRDWSPRTSTRMAQLCGVDVNQDDARDKIKARLESSLDAMLKTRANEGRDIFIKPYGATDYLALVKRRSSGYTGQIVVSKHGLEQVDDARLIKTLIHEHAHLGGNLNDNWYVKLDGNGNFYRKAPSRGDGTLPPLRLDDALNNADTIAYAAIVLADDGNTDRDAR